MKKILGYLAIAGVLYLVIKGIKEVKSQPKPKLKDK